MEYLSINNINCFAKKKIVRANLKHSKTFSKRSWVQRKYHHHSNISTIIVFGQIFKNRAGRLACVDGLNQGWGKNMIL